MNAEMKLEPLTEAQIRTENREYNPSEWDRIINRFSSYKNARFYVARQQKGYEYQRYFATYETSEGIIYFNSVSYSSSITSNGFCRVTISPDGNLYKFLMEDTAGNKGYCENNTHNRAVMASASKRFGSIFTNII